MLRASSVSASPALAANDDAPKPVDRVLIISLPYLSWSDLDGRDDVPNITRLLDQSAVADLSVRAPSIRPDLAGGYATLSAGDKAVASGTADDGAGFEVDEHVGAGTAAQAFARRTGTDAARGLVHLGLPQIVEANASTDFEAEVGALGDALEDAGYSRAVIANGDGVELPTPAPESDDDIRRGVAPLPARRGRRVDGRGRHRARRPACSKDLLEDDAERRVRCAARQRRRRRRVRGRVEAEVGRAGGGVRPRPRRRLHATSSRPTSGRGVLTHALRASDALVGRLLDSVDPARDAVVVVGPAASSGGGVLTIAAVRAPGFEPGLLRSGTTQRTGYVQLMDMGPTVLDLLDVARPDSMRGRAGRGGRPGRQRGRPARLPRRRERRVDVPRPHRERGAERVRGAGVAARGRGGRRAVAAALPTAAGRAAVVRVRRSSRTSRRCTWRGCSRSTTWAWPRTGCSSRLCSIALGVLYRVVARGRDLDAVMIGLGVLVAVLVVDVVLGNPLQFNSALGFSPSVAGRFIGFGNAGYAALAAAALAPRRACWRTAWVGGAARGGRWGSWWSRSWPTARRSGVPTWAACCRWCPRTASPPRCSSGSTCVSAPWSHS